MKNLFLNEIIKAVNGKLLGRGHFQDCCISGVSIDTRDELEGKLFIPLKGERVDGHSFIEKAFANGASCCLSEIKIETDKPVILVDSTYDALKALAEYYKSLLSVVTVAVTGSVGKTTTKDMVASVLEQTYNVLKTEGNYNNEIGLPLTIFKLEETHQYAVLEMGMNQFGEIHNLSKIARPDICVITNIGISHIENLGSREGILKAKCEIFDYAKEGCCAILCGDDDMLIGLKDGKKNVLYYGMDVGNHIFADELQYNSIESISCTIHMDGTGFRIKIPYPGKHMVLNALAATAVGRQAGMTIEEIQAGIENFKLTKMRMDITESKNGFVIINDVYNASPASMKAAIDILAVAEGNRRVCILGDMLELGSFSEEMHKEVGSYMEGKCIDLAIFIGKDARYSYLALLSGQFENHIMHFEDQQEFLTEMPGILKAGDVILVKASRGMQFEKIVDAITAV